MEVWAQCKYSCLIATGEVINTAPEHVFESMSTILFIKSLLQFQVSYSLTHLLNKENKFIRISAPLSLFSKQIHIQNCTEIGFWAAPIFSPNDVCHF